MIARLAAVAVLVASLVTVPTAAGASAPPVVIGHRVIGYSVEHRPIIAWHVGDPSAGRPKLIIGQIHGDEHAGVRLTRSILRGTARVVGVNLWIIPTMNPDGDARHTRQNAHGVDLNRNWPANWAHLTGEYYSGPRPLSEPETRVVRTFILDVRPRYVVVLHQPLLGVDSDAGSGPAYRSFRNALARNLGLPVKNFDCWSTCHGALSVWFQRHHLGVAVETVEFGWHPTVTYLTGRARRGIVAALGGRFVGG